MKCPYWLPEYACAIGRAPGCNALPASQATPASVANSAASNPSSPASASFITTSRGARTGVGPTAVHSPAGSTA